MYRVISNSLMLSGETPHANKSSSDIEQLTVNGNTLNQPLQATDQVWVDNARLIAKKYRYRSELTEQDIFVVELRGYSMKTLNTV